MGEDRKIGGAWNEWKEYLAKRKAMSREVGWRKRILYIFRRESDIVFKLLIFRNQQISMDGKEERYAEEDKWSLHQQNTSDRAEFKERCTRPYMAHV